MRGDRVKHIATQTKFRPVPDTFEVETESFSESESESRGHGSSHGSSTGLSETESESWLDDSWLGHSSSWDTDDAVTRSQSRAESSSSGFSESESSGSGSSSIRGGSRSIVPITRHEEFREETGRQFWTLEEEWERLIGLLHGLSKREALVKVYNRPVLHIVTPTVEPERTDERSRQFQVKVKERCPYVKSAGAVTTQIEERRKELAAMTEATEMAGRPFKVKSFRE